MTNYGYVIVLISREIFNFYIDLFHLQGHNSLDLLQVRHVLPPDALEAPKILLKQEHLNGAHCNPDIFRCTLTKIPETNSILQKSRLPLGVLIHPFKDLTVTLVKSLTKIYNLNSIIFFLQQLPVIQCQTIVRCRSCRTYINPFVYFVDQRRWKCNLCFRINDCKFLLLLYSSSILITF